MPVDHSKNGFLKDIGTDWVALSANGTPLSRAATEAGVRRAAPNADRYINGGALNTVVKVKAQTMMSEHPVIVTEPAPAIEPVADTTTASADTTTASADTTTASADTAAAGTFDHDGDGKPGGSKKGAEATASKTRRQRKPA